MKIKQMISILAAVLVFSQTVSTVGATTLSENGLVEICEADDEENGDLFQAADESRAQLLEIIKEKPIYALVTNGDYYNMYSEPALQGICVGAIPSGTQVSICDVDFSESGTYYYVTCGLNGNTVTGYIDSKYVVTADTDFNQWLADVSAKSGVALCAEETNVESIYKNFPSGYHSKLIALANAHPNWTFVPYNTGLEWYDSVMAEMQGTRSLVYSTVDNSWKSMDAGDYDVITGQFIPKSGVNWFRASQTAVSYCMNPLNYLDETHIFAFEQLTYNRDVHNRDGVNAVIRNSWMFERPLEDGSAGLYCDVFMSVGAATGVSPYHLASRVLQEQGTAGTAALISGYGGVYNYFNVQASGATAAEILASGTAYAQSQGWTTRYLSIWGGAGRLGTNYITKGQDTLYLQKFDVDSSYYGLYSHQYMQNIQAPTTESASVYRAYSTAGALGNNFVFKVPVFNSMPDNGDYIVTEYPTSEAFITQVYSTVLGRQPDAEGLQYWLSVQRRGVHAADIVASFFDSAEMKNKNLSNEEFLAYAYGAILGRQPDEEGKNYWLSFLSQGATKRWVVSCFVTSKEFTQLCGNFGIVRGTVSRLSEADKNARVAMFVTRIYRNVLKRDPDEEGLIYWSGCINNGMSGAGVVERFVDSKEFMNANISNEEFLERLYDAVLGRHSDPEGLAYWANYMNSGHSRKQVLTLFLDSKEFHKICESYSVKAGG